MGMRGRLVVHTIALFLEGDMVLNFANSNSLAASIVILVIFSTFVQMTEGTTYGIVQYVDPPNTGTISGSIGAGGCFGLGFRQVSYLDALYIMAGCIMGSSLLSLLVFIPGHRGLASGEDDPSNQAFKSSEALTVPEPEDDAEVGGDAAM